MTEPGKISGTAHFMSPEQASNAPVDGRSDIYALGVVGYLAVSGRLPFESSNLPALLLRQATEAPSSVMRVAPGLPPALGAVIDKCLSLDPAGRFPDGETMAAALVPTTETRPVLPTTLRAWLAARNPLIVPYMAYLAAENERLHGSGVIAVVIAGLMLGHRSTEIQSAASRVTERVIWRTVQLR